MSASEDKEVGVRSFDERMDLFGGGVAVCVCDAVAVTHTGMQ